MGQDILDIQYTIINPFARLFKILYFWSRS